MKMIMSPEILDYRWLEMRLTVMAITTICIGLTYVSSDQITALRRSGHRCDSIGDYYYSIEHRIIMRRVHSLVASRNVR